MVSRHRPATLAPCTLLVVEWTRRIARPVAPLLSARHRRWKRLQSSLDFDPSEVQEELEEPPAGDFIVCGCPRTGTSLLSAQLFQPPQIITVMEPWDGLRMPPAALFRSLRSEIEGGVLSRGRLDVEALREEDRVDWHGEGAKLASVKAEADFRLGVKWPAFWRYLDLLPHTRFLVCVRDPVETVASFKSSGARLAQGLDYEAAFNREMNTHLLAATRDDELRRVLLYEYINSRILAQIDRPNVLVVRYERWFQDPDGLRSEIGDFLGTPFDSWPAQIRPPASSSTGLSDRELGFIREYCRSATVLGYQSMS